MPLRGNPKFDLTNQRFGQLLAVEFIGGKFSQWLCVCDCGEEIVTKSQTLRVGSITSCGHNKPGRRDITGETFGWLKVIKRVPCPDNRASKVICYLCECSCKNKTQKIISKQSLTGGRAKSCGCWGNQRKGKNNPNWAGVGDLGKTYWGRLIKGADERGIEVKLTIEQASEIFEKQDKRCAKTGLPIHFHNNEFGCTASLDRKDSNGSYEINNVEWVHKVVQMMKNCFSNEDFVGWCYQIAEFNKKDIEDGTIPKIPSNVETTLRSNML